MCVNESLELLTVLLVSLQSRPGDLKSVSIDEEKEKEKDTVFMV